MPTLTINGTSLYYEIHGAFGEPLVLVHGSWVDHNSWNAVTGKLAEHFRVLVYDRRGHSKSPRRFVPATMHDHAADLENLIEALDFAPAHVAGSSYGAILSLRLAGNRPDLFRTLVVHEPPLMTLLEPDQSLRPELEGFGRQIGVVAGLLEEGKNEEAARTFAETIAFGPGEWEKLPQQLRDTFVNNAPTFLDELHDPENLRLDLTRLQGVRFPALLSTGTQSPPLFGHVAELLMRNIPGLERAVIPGAGHVPHISHPDAYSSMVKEFVGVKEHAM